MRTAAASRGRRWHGMLAAGSPAWAPGRASEAAGWATTPVAGAVPRRLPLDASPAWRRRAGVAAAALAVLA
ncbi:MAG: hypothetical protein V4801_32235, partial [Burkholderia gladioli]